MSNSRMDKLSRNSLAVVIIIFLIVSLILAVFQKPKLEQYKVFKIYTKTSENVISDLVDKSTLKELNIANSEFENRFNGSTKVSILPQEGIAAYYRIKAVSNKSISEDELNSIFKEYVNFIKQKNIENIEHISPIEYQNIAYDNFGMRNIIISLIQTVFFSLVFFILYRILASRLSKEKLNTFSLVSILAYTFSIVAGGVVILTAIYITISIILKILDRNKTNEKKLIVITLMAAIMRCLVTAVMLAYNYYKYRTLYSYSQTDEIFYYSTGDYIYQSLINFKMPNLRQITGIDQYGYNLFVGVTKVLNKGDIFFTVKVINILISVVFVILFFDFVYKITKNENIATISSVLMAIMPTFAVFSSFALRDIIISISIFIILSEAIVINTSNKKLHNIIKIIIFAVILWYLRKYALLLTVAFAILYLIVKFAIDRKINILVIIGAMVLGVAALIFIASKMYAFNIFSSITSYILSNGIFKFLSGLILSLVNLDFIINSGATLYTSTKSVILRTLYPETLFLVITFPIMCLGLVKAKSKNFSLVITSILIFAGFISIYKIQYGGWFLRTQLQIFPYQYLFIAWGINELMPNLKFKFLRFGS